jgi:hypothetical protein
MDATVSTSNNTGPDGYIESVHDLPVLDDADPELGDQKLMLPDDVNVLQHPLRMCISG